MPFIFFYSFFMWLIKQWCIVYCLAALLKLMESWIMNVNKIWHALQGSSLIIVIVKLLYMHAKLIYIQKSRHFKVTLPLLSLFIQRTLDLKSGSSIVFSVVIIQKTNKNGHYHNVFAHNWTIFRLHLNQASVQNHFYNVIY